ncbi:dTMP kinase [Streptomyces sp. NPDC049936]|uniref:dTMP kinase n=1 Tax=Streptomyces sp. NPDC049936 TaxID=3365599 RepID=UPI0037AB2AD0
MPIPRMPYGAPPYAPPRTACPKFTVLLGPDYAGKSSVLRRFADSGSWTVVTCDQGPLDTDYPLIGRARRELLPEALGAPAGRYSPDVLLTLMQLAVVHMRDRVTGAPPGRPVIVDSYYLKILAKCTLLGYANPSLFSWWRSFPQPDRVVYLDVPPAVAWERSGRGAALNPMEHYGDTPTEEGFTRFQDDLRDMLRTEVAGMRVTTLPQGSGIDRAVDAVDAVVHAPGRRAGVRHG